MISKRMNKISFSLFLVLSLGLSQKICAEGQMSSFIKGGLCSFVPLLGPNLMRWVAEDKNKNEKQSMYYGFTTINVLGGVAVSAGLLKCLATVATIGSFPADNDGIKTLLLCWSLLPTAECRALLGSVVWDQTRVNRDFDEAFAEESKE